MCVCGFQQVSSITSSMWTIYGYSPGSPSMRHQSGLCYLPLNWSLFVGSWAFFGFGVYATYIFLLTAPIAVSLDEAMNGGLHAGPSYATVTFWGLMAAFALLPSIPCVLFLSFPSYFNFHKGYEHWYLWPLIVGMYGFNTCNVVHWIWEMSLGNTLFSVPSRFWEYNAIFVGVYILIAISMVLVYEYLAGLVNLRQRGVDTSNYVDPELAEIPLASHYLEST